MSSNNCPICHEDIDFFCFGECLHPTCVKCAIKLRLFHKTDTSDQSKCPTCRRSLNRNSAIKNHYKKQLDCNCSKCPSKFPTMSALNRHMFSDHKLSYCDLCLKFARLLPSEFVPMTAQELVQHKKYIPELKRGHPKCQFCNKFYYEFEDLIKHIRDNHFMCDICNSGMNIEVFSTQEELIDHYENCHFICLECRRENKITFFATSEELGSHSFSVHGSDSWLPVSIVMSSSRNAPLRYENPDLQPVPARSQSPVQLTAADFPSLTTESRNDENRNSKNKSQKSITPSQCLASLYVQPAPRSREEEFPSLAGPSTNKKNKSKPQNSWNNNIALPLGQPTSSQSVAPKEKFSVPKKNDFPTLNSNKKVDKKSASILRNEFEELSLANRTTTGVKLNKYAQRILESQKSASTTQKKTEIEDIPEKAKQQKSGKKKKNRPSVLEDEENGNVDTLRDINFKLSKRDQIKGIGYMNYDSLSSSRPAASTIQVRDISNPQSTKDFVIAETSDTKTSTKKNKKNDFFDEINQSRTGNSSIAKISTKSDFPALPSASIKTVPTKPITSAQSESKTKNQKKKTSEIVAEKRIILDCVDPEDIIYRKMTFFFSNDFSEKNLKLIEDFQSFLIVHGRTKSPFQKFTEISREFFEGKMPGVSFILILLSILPKDQSFDEKISNLFAQMLAYLPNIARQRTLFRCIQGACIPRTGSEQTDQEFLKIFKQQNEANPLSKDNLPEWFAMTVKMLSPCKTCKQIFLKSEYADHVGFVHA